MSKKKKKGKENIALLTACQFGEMGWGGDDLTLSAEFRTNTSMLHEILEYSAENMDEIMETEEYKKWKIKKELKG